MKVRKLNCFRALALSAVVALCATSCLKESDDTLILPVPDGTISSTVIPTEVINAITSTSVMQIHQGLTPPVMITDTLHVPNNDGGNNGNGGNPGDGSEGTVTTRDLISAQFVCSPELLVYASDSLYNPGDRFDDVYFAFVGQSSSNIVQYYERQGSSTSYSGEAQIIGEGNDFTVYFYEDGQFTDGKTFRKATIISGTWTDEGVKDYEICFVMLDKQDANNDLMRVNYYRVYRDGDGMASKCHWLTEDMLKK